MVTSTSVGQTRSSVVGRLREGLWWEFVCLVVGIKSMGIWECLLSLEDWLGAAFKQSQCKHQSGALGTGAGLNPLWLFTDICGPSSWEKKVTVNTYA